MPPNRIGDELILRAVQDQIDVVTVQVPPQRIEAVLVVQPTGNTVHVGRGTQSVWSEESTSVPPNPRQSFRSKLHGTLAKRIHQHGLVDGGQPVEHRCALYV